MKIEKYEFVDSKAEGVNAQAVDYSYIFAPKAKIINAKSAGIIFCGKDTEVLVPCKDIRRGDFYLEKGYIRDHNNPEFQFELSFNNKTNKAGMILEGGSTLKAVKRFVKQLEKTAIPMALCKKRNIIG